jgi:hypothetical protein
MSAAQTTRKRKKAASKKETPTQKAPAGLINDPRPNAEEEWTKLKHFVGGNRATISELEKRLLTNDSEDLNIDPLEPAYPPHLRSRDNGGSRPSQCWFYLP